MKKSMFYDIIRWIVMAVAMAFSVQAYADATYPVTNPTYIPTARSASVSYSAPADYVVTTNDINTSVFQITGTCTSLAAVAQITVDGTNYVDVNVYPVGSGTVGGVSTAAASISAAGMYRVNTSGASKTRLHITALTAACAVTASGSSGAFTAAE